MSKMLQDSLKAPATSVSHPSCCKSLITEPPASILAPPGQSVTAFRHQAEQVIPRPNPLAPSCSAQGKIQSPHNGCRALDDLGYCRLFGLISCPSPFSLYSSCQNFLYCTINTHSRILSVLCTGTLLFWSGFLPDVCLARSFISFRSLLTCDTDYIVLRFIVLQRYCFFFFF